MNIVILGLSITSSWGNGHATTYRGLVRELVARGHRVRFLERDAPWYAQNRDLPKPPYGKTALYDSMEELKDRFAHEVREADLVMVGSFVPDGIEVGEWVTREAKAVTAFYDIDTPYTLAQLAKDQASYLSRALIPRYSLYFSFTGGPTLARLQREFRAQRAKALYCSFDPQVYYPEPRQLRWDLGYLGTYAECRQPALESLMLEPARRWRKARMVVGGPQYPQGLRWPSNVERINHLAPSEHRAFYNAQRFTLNVTRADMVVAGFSPSVRLFEAAGCGTPIITDAWPGLEKFFKLGQEILVSRGAEDTLRYLRELSEEDRLELARKARARVLREHTAAHRAEELESCVLGVRSPRRAAAPSGSSTRSARRTVARVARR